MAAVASVLDRPRPVTAVPRAEGVRARLADAFPRVGIAAMPLVVAQARRAQQRILRAPTSG